MQDERLARLLDRTDIFDLVRLERHARDVKDWTGLQNSFLPDAPVRTTWFDGTAAEFVEASKKKMGRTGAIISSPKHWIMPTVLQIEGDRALVESQASIFDRLTLDSVEFDIFQYCRFVSRVVRTGDGWKLASFEGIYQRDYMRSVNPADPLPVDWDLVKTLRPSYRFLAYTQLRRGYTVNPELLGDDRPDLLESFYAAEKAWLHRT
ncbi:nuclear transport factor 2 family protein [Pararobbsia silviterrae]|uniref:Nuclear transport factor 2 family protein n=1 Tax=Pararobbsia silviterrae TaxID=1792498 RepID=A0A494YBK1_9BURK|nr:nuclear transport factor 2 family protein [Pararobbsia silviterrae]RKP57670.1 nuclear transport factor 2 family protein [Pararobbsia silviterrae]